jgi:hypothetical protein
MAGDRRRRRRQPRPKPTLRERTREIQQCVLLLNELWPESPHAIEF